MARTVEYVHVRVIFSPRNLHTFFLGSVTTALTRYESSMIEERDWKRLSDARKPVRRKERRKGAAGDENLSFFGG